MSEVKLSNLANALKEYYPSNEITSQIHNMTPLMAELEKETKEIVNSGRGLVARCPIMTRRNSSAGAVSESGVLPTGRAPEYLMLEIGVANNYGTVEFSGLSLKAATKNSFLSELDIKMQGLREGMELDMDRQMSNGNSTGMLAMTNGAGAGADATVTLDKPGTQFLQVGMPVYTLNAESAGTAAADEDISQGLTEPTAHTVGSIADNGTTFELYDYSGASVATEKWHNDHYLFRYGSAGKESMGLKGICDNETDKATASYYQLGTATTTIHGLSRATYPILDCTHSYNIAAPGTNRDITEKIITTHLNKIEKNSGQKSHSRKNIFFSSYELRDRMFDEISPDRRFENNTIDLKGGYKTIAYQYGNALIPWIVSKQAIPNTLFTLDLNFIKIYQSGMYEWIEQVTGSMFDIKVDASGRYHVYIATLANISGMGCTNFKAQGIIRDLTEA